MARAYPKEAADGAALGLAVWAIEAVALVGGAAGVGGLDVAASLVDDLCAWGLAYAAVGAIAGLAGRWAPLAWLALLVVGDAAVVPKVAHAGLVALATAAWLGFRRLPQRRALAPLAVAPALAAVALWPGSGPAETGTPGAGPDVVLIVVDTLRADHATTPTLARLAGEGLTFTHARSTSSWTLPAHASLFTGLYPSEHGAHAGHPVLDDGPETLAEALDARGYRTVGLSANGWVSAGTGLARGFERFEFLGDDGLVSQLLLPLAFGRSPDLGAGALTDRAVGALQAARAAGEPLFLFVNLLEAHEPLGAIPDGPIDPARGRRWMRDMPLAWCTCAGDEAPAGDVLGCRDGLYRASGERAAAVRAAYAAGVSYVDAHIAEIAAAVEGPTWLVVTSDHGEHVGEDGRLGHMVWADDALLDIPLIVRGPGVPAGSVDADPFDLSELAPWLLAWVDGRPPPPRKLAARSEVHAHPSATARRWGALFGCDFSPATTARRVLVTPAGITRAEGPEAGLSPGDGASVDPTTRRALEALGYVE